MYLLPTRHFFYYGNNRLLSKDPDAAIKLAQTAKIDEKKLININEIDFRPYLKSDIDTNKYLCENVHDIILIYQMIFKFLDKNTHFRK